MPSAIDPKEHKKSQKDRKIRNMTQSPNENEAAVAKNKTKGPEWQKPTLQKNSFSLVDQILSEIDLNEDLSIQDAKGNEIYQVVDLIKPEPIINEKHDGKKCDKCDGKGCKHCDGNGYHEIEEASMIKKGHCCNEEDDEDMGEKKYCKKCKKKEYRSECKYGGKVWDKMTSDEDDDSSDDVSEAVRIKARTGNLIAVILTWRGKSLMVRMFFPSLKYPSRKEVELEVVKVYPDARVINYKRIEVTPGAPVVHVSEEAEIDEIHMLTPKLKKNTSTTEKKSKSDANRYGEDPEDYARRMRKKQKEYASRTEEKNVHGEIENPSGNLKKLVSKAVKRVDTDVDGDVEHNDEHKGEYGEFVPTPDGKRKYTSSGPKPAYKGPTK